MKARDVTRRQFLAKSGVVLGDDILTGSVNLREKPPGSGEWRFDG